MTPEQIRSALLEKRHRAAVAGLHRKYGSRGVPDGQYTDKLFTRDGCVVAVLWIHDEERPFRFDIAVGRPAVWSGPDFSVARFDVEGGEIVRVYEIVPIYRDEESAGRSR